MRLSSRSTCRHNVGKSHTSCSQSTNIRHLCTSSSASSEVFHAKPTSWWLDRANRVQFLTHVAKREGYTKREDFYRLTKATLIEAGGTTLLKLFNDSPSAVIKATFPDHPWQDWEFSYVPRGTWANPTALRGYFDSLAAKLNFTEKSDWYTVTSKQIENNGGKGLLKYYGMSISRALAVAYPEHNWEVWRFHSVPKGWWKVHAHRLQFLNSIAKELRLQSLEDWYNVTREAIASRGGGGILSVFDGSLPTLVMNTYPHHSWMPWRFKSPPRRWWQSAQVRKAFFEWLRKEHFCFSDLTGWYFVSGTQIIQLGGLGILNDFEECPALAITEAYSDEQTLYEWKFIHLSGKWWKHKQLRRKFFSWLMKELHGLDSITSENIYLLENCSMTGIFTGANGAAALLAAYERSIANALIDTFDDLSPRLWKFECPNKPWWNDMLQLRDCLNECDALNPMPQSDTGNPPDHWYEISDSELRVHIKDHGFWKEFDSAASVLIKAFPDKTWEPWRFKNSVPRAWWKQHQNQVTFLQWLLLQCNVDTSSSESEWEKLTRKVIVANGGGPLFQYFSSVQSIIQTLLPDHYNSMKKAVCRTNFTKEEQRSFWNDIVETKMGGVFENLYSVSKEIVASQPGGNTLLAQHGGSVMQALMFAFPEIEWFPWKFVGEQLPAGWWENMDNQRWFLDWLRKHVLKSDSLESLYSVTTNVIRQHGGGSLLKLYNTSATLAIVSIYPEHRWQMWKFTQVPRQWWQSRQHQLEFMEWIQQNVFKFKDMDGWYKVTVQDIDKHGGNGLFTIYGKSIHSILRNVYPEHSWMPWKFVTSPLGGSSTIAAEINANTKLFEQFVVDVGQTYGVKNLADWYRISRASMPTQIGSIIDKLGGLGTILMKMYPQHQWDRSKFEHAMTSNSKKSLQLALKRALERICRENVIEEHVSQTLSHSNSAHEIQLDLYIPSLDLAFEYQGLQHYFDVHVFGETENQQHRDVEKAVLCASNCLRVVEVPFWWNESETSVELTIQRLSRYCKS